MTTLKILFLTGIVIYTAFKLVDLAPPWVVLIGAGLVAFYELRDLCQEKPDKTGQ